MTDVGIDVGGSRKGFHTVALEGPRVVEGPERIPDAPSVLAWVERVRPRIVAVDSPKACAPPGASSRSGERGLAKAICGIRFTPDRATVEGSAYYEWIRCGLGLFEELEQHPGRRWEAIEVFPTASWTVWFGPRGARSRASWTRDALGRMNLRGLPDRRLSQDDRDAIAAAVTACLHAECGTRRFGEIAVPSEPWPAGRE
ncbi:MAG TPA: DUF429 domain-containing protein [Solirubrobacterales bacterium]|nr:DUF429 domain-containing protein [Solirubrobacterales bacterium]